MQQHDWSKFVKRISINADPKTLYTSWTTQDNLEKWFLSNAEFTSSSGDVRERHSHISVGDTYSWMWHGSEHVAEGKILESNNIDFLKFTFLGCVVSVTIKNESGENIIELIQSAIPLDETSRKNYYVGCTRGWTFFMTNLKSILEGGIDLRNRNKDLINVINT